jgi:hypothetical protein
MKTAEIELFGKKLKLYERVTRDCFQLATMVKTQEDNLTNRLIFSAIMIQDSLRPNFKWWNFILKRRCSYKGLFERLSPSEMGELIDKINEIEGKKKVTKGESQSEEMSQSD